MFTLKSLPSFTCWLKNLEDHHVKGVVLARLRRIELGLLGDTKSLGEGLFEARIHIGAGWRIYFTERQGQIILLLMGGSKRTQSRDIRMARKLMNDLE